MTLIKSIKYFVLIFSVSIYIFASETLTGKVVSILDGDTIILLDHDKNQRKIRLAGIDEPEKNQDFGTQTKKNLSNKIFGKKVEVKIQTTDRYGRFVGNIYLNNRWINLEMVQEGFAWHYKRYSSDHELARAEKHARDFRLGLWRDKYPVPPWEFRHGGKYEKGFIHVTPEMYKELNKQADEQTKQKGEYWLNTNTGVRHNSTCKNFGKTSRGKYCSKDEGRTCGICGG